MNVDRSKVGRARMASINRKARGDMRTSDLVLAVVGVALLGGFCLLGLANWVGEAQGFASITGPLSPEVSGGLRHGLVSTSHACPIGGRA